MLKNFFNKFKKPKPDEDIEMIVIDIKLFYIN